MTAFNDLLIQNPVIAALKSDDGIESALNSDCLIVFVLYGSLLSIGEITEKLKASGKKVFIHIDLIEGLKADQSGILFIKQSTAADGIITTRQHLIKHAKNLSLFTILRLFVIDSKSIRTGAKNTSEFAPDAVEVLPGVSEKIIRVCNGEFSQPVIAGGLIETRQEILAALDAGAVAISTTRSQLWE